MKGKLSDERYGGLESFSLAYSPPDGYCLPYPSKPKKKSFCLTGKIKIVEYSVSHYRSHCFVTFLVKSLFSVLFVLFLKKKWLSMFIVGFVWDNSTGLMVYLGFLNMKKSVLGLFWNEN